MTLTPTGYRPRVIDAELARCLKLFGAVEIRGPKWCGKTWAGLNQSVDEVYIADPSDGYVTRLISFACGKGFWGVTLGIALSRG